MTNVLGTLLAPAVALSARLAMVWKILLVCAVLLVPTFLLGNGYRSGMAAQTSFVASERAGIEYAKPLTGLLAATVHLRTLDERAALGDRSAQAVLPAAQDAIRRQTAAMDAVAARKPGGLDIDTQWHAARAALLAYANRAPGQSPVRELAGADAALAAVNAALTQTLNASYLILDPDLDSYSLMDAWLLRMPVVLDLATRSAGAVQAALPHGAVANR